MNRSRQGSNGTERSSRRKTGPSFAAPPTNDHNLELIPGLSALRLVVQKRRSRKFGRSRHSTELNFPQADFRGMVAVSFLRVRRYQDLPVLEGTDVRSSERRMAAAATESQPKRFGCFEKKGLFQHPRLFSTIIFWACRNRGCCRLDRSRQIHAVPTSDQLARCELETQDTVSCPDPACER